MQNNAFQLAKSTLSANVKLLIGGNSPAQLKAAQTKTGVASRTISNMISLAEGNPTLKTMIEFAQGYKVDFMALFKPNLGRLQQSGNLAVNESQSADYSANITKFERVSHPTIDELTGIANTINDVGLGELIVHANQIAVRRPRNKTAT